VSGEGPRPASLELTLGWVAEAMGAERPARDADAAVGDVVTDSRVLREGDLFVALRGPRFDGHAFVREVLERGAAGVVVERGRGVGGARAIEVDDTLGGLQRLAHAIRKASGTKVVAITGSAGKTTTKEAIAELLALRFRVVRNKGNLNNHIGLPQSLMQLRTGPDVAVMELGMNHAGEIRRLVEIATPDVRVWTNVGDAHLGFFASADAIADAKAEILHGAASDTLLVCNADDARVMARVRAFPGRTLTFGRAEDAMVRARSVRHRGLAGMEAEIVTPAGETTLTTALLGEGNLSNLLAATTVALDLDVPLAAVAAGVARLQPQPRRGALRRLRDGITVVDDSYNSSPAALHRTLEVIAHETGVTRRVAVLGEMLELGDHAIALHEASGRAAAESGLARLFTVGGAAARVLAEAAVAAGLPAGAVEYFETSAAAADAVLPAVRPGDLVLVKGSRGTRCDVVVDRLVAELG